MGRFSCCWCLFILLFLVVIVTNTGNAKKNSEQKRQKKEQIKSSEGAENTARNKQQNGKKTGETKPFEKKTEGRKKVKKNKSARKKKLRAKDEEGGDYSTLFDPNWACNRNQARNYCFGSGFAGHDVSILQWGGGGGLGGIPHTLDRTGRVTGTRRGTTASDPASLGTM